ncbi:bacillithiol system redox-active protein YtxJ [Olivibacter sitiensis]|uniref:bacillithiol system redox-active protein YtxJ n=1 Tax=Olivibacter sitiensis TaxID=376470 RepID=UPI0003F9C325|nr:bacillithiol system redox-active protein YtxJ [Olivibacter sitiensis]
MEWIKLNDLKQLEEIGQQEGYSLIFKHSTRCPVSSMAKRQFEMERDLLPADLPCYFLDLIAHRDISNAVAQKWDVQHESPQLLLIYGNKCVYNESHSGIDAQETRKQLQ